MKLWQIVGTSFVVVAVIVLSVTTAILTKVAVVLSNADYSNTFLQLGNYGSYLIEDSIVRYIRPDIDWGAAFWNILFGMITSPIGIAIGIGVVVVIGGIVANKIRREAIRRLHDDLKKADLPTGY